MKEFFQEKYKAKNNVTYLLNTNSVTPSSKASSDKGSLDLEDKKRLNEKAVLVYLNLQKEKIEFDDTIDEEYVEKVVMFGFLMVNKINLYSGFHIKI